MPAPDDPVFIARDGEIWACWFNGRPAVNLGSEQNFWAAAEQLFDDLNPAKPSPATPAAERAPIEERGPQVDREERHDVTIVGRLFGAGGSREVTIYDLSTHGCRVEDHSNARPGALVSVRIGTVGPVDAVIRWRRDKAVGLKFEAPLYPSVLDHIRTRFSQR